MLFHQSLVSNQELSQQGVCEVRQHHSSPKSEMKTPKPFSWRPAADSNTNPASSVLVDGTQPKLRLYLTFITHVWCCVHLSSKSSFGNYFYLLRLFNRKKRMFTL